MESSWVNRKCSIVNCTTNLSYSIIYYSNIHNKPIHIETWSCRLWTIIVVTFLFTKLLLFGFVYAPYTILWLARDSIQGSRFKRKTRTRIKKAQKRTFAKIDIQFELSVYIIHTQFYFTWNCEIRLPLTFIFFDLTSKKRFSSILSQKTSSIRLIV